jgi:predicted nucleic acid-binding protein
MAIGILASEIKRDFDDTPQYYVAKKLGASGIVSFDRHFDGLDIPRLEPGKIVADE